MSSVGEQVHEARSRLKWSQQRLAEEAGVSRFTVLRLEQDLTTAVDGWLPHGQDRVRRFIRELDAPAQDVPDVVRRIREQRLQAERERQRAN